MLSHRHDVPRARALGEGCPRVGLEARRGEAGDEVFVAEGPLRAVGLRVVPVLVAPLHVHELGVPLAALAIGGHRVDPPVEEDA